MQERGQNRHVSVLFSMFLVRLLRINGAVDSQHLPVTSLLSSFMCILYTTVTGFFIVRSNIGPMHCG